MKKELFKLRAPFSPTGDQPTAIRSIADGFRAGAKNQTLVGVTGSGKTFTMANIIAKLQKPTLIISHNKTLAAQLYQEFKEFFPENAVHYFVSYYDYYQPEAYLPQSDTYIEKDAKINEVLDQLRHSATQDILTRKDVIVIASVSCIYNIGSPEEYKDLSLKLRVGQKFSRHDLLEKLNLLQYTRNDTDLLPGTFRARGQIIEALLPTAEKIIRISLGARNIEQLEYVGHEEWRHGTTQWHALQNFSLFPAKYWVAPDDKIKIAVKNIEDDLAQRLAYFKKNKKPLEAQRLRERTLMDIAMLLETGYCYGIENYSRYLEFRTPQSPPYTLLDFFNYSFGDTKKASENDRGFLCFIDESHMTIPQIRGMSAGDRARKETLVEYGFRLPSALDNRPLQFEEFTQRIGQTLFVSATPAPYELEQSGKHITEQLIRPTGLLDPEVEVRPTKNQIQDLIKEIKERTKRKERTLITALTKRLSEDLADFLKNEGLQVQYLHSEIKTLERSDILKKLREGDFDVLVGVNLLREGLDLPEVSLILILDADKEGFLRNTTSLIQTMGRASRNIHGKVILYADNITASMRQAIEETVRRRNIQMEYNKSHHIEPRPIVKAVRESIIQKPEAQASATELEETLALLAGDPRLPKTIAQLSKKMKLAAKELDFEEATRLRDTIKKLKEKI